MAASILPHINAIPPRPDVTHPTSALYGAAKRMAYKPKPVSNSVLKGFRRFVRKWLRDNLLPLDESEDFDFEEWLSMTNYPNKRKEVLRKAYSEIVGDELFDEHKLNVNAKVKYFVKEEWYPEYKHFRGIWTRDDAFKCLCGPFFKKIEEQLFKLPYFIKKIPKDERADYIMQFMDKLGYIFQSTDFTAYESHFTTKLMYYCERELYKYMVSKTLKGQRLLRLIFYVIANFNYVVNKYFILAVCAKRMSGEMNTSLGNSFANLMFLLYACYLYKIDILGPLVEGDDGLAGLSKNIPAVYFDDMGLNVKMEVVEEISYASFCGMVFDPVERICITDPRKPLATIMWVPRRFAQSKTSKILGLVKCKALCMIYEFPGCPIISVLAHKVFSLLSGVEMYDGNLNNYERAMFKQYVHRYVNKDVPIAFPGSRTRVLMEKMYLVDISMQLRIEEDIKLMTLDFWDTRSALNIMPELWISNYHVYVVNRTTNRRNFCDFSMSGTKNKYLDNLYMLRQDGSVKKSIGQLLTFAQYMNHGKFKGVPVLEVFQLYKTYVIDYVENHFILMKTLAPIHFGMH